MGRGPLIAMPDLSPSLCRVYKDVFMMSTRRVEGGCLIWTGSYMNGVPMWSCAGLQTTARKWARHLFCEPVLAGTIVKATCGNRRCVEPTHTSIGRKSAEKAPSEPVEAAEGKTWGKAPAKRVKPATRLRAATHAPLVINLTDDNLDWKLTKHARDRMDEFRYRLDEVLLAVNYPDNLYPSHERYGPDTYVCQKGDLAVAIAMQSRVILTVLLRKHANWLHGIDTREGAQVGG